MQIPSASHGPLITVPPRGPAPAHDGDSAPPGHDFDAATLAELLAFAGWLLPPVGDREAGAGSGAGAPSHPADARQAAAVAFGRWTLRQLRQDPDAYPIEDVAALGGQRIVDLLLHGNHAARMRALAEAALEAHGMAGKADGAGKDDASIAAQMESFLQAGFADEMALAQAVLDLAALKPPTRQALAADLLRGAGLDPARRVDTPELMEPDNPLAVNERKPAAGFYLNADALNDADIRRMSDRPLTDADTGAVRGRLPASLDAEFSRRFDAYAADAARRITALAERWLTCVARELGYAADTATVEIAAARRQHYRREVQVLRGAAFLYDGRTDRETPSSGYFATLRTATGAYRYFLSTEDGGIHRVPPDVTLQAWAEQRRDIVFGASAEGTDGTHLWKTRVAIDPIGSGPRPDLAHWLTPALQTRLGRSKAQARGLAPGEQAIDVLLDFVPFRRMIVAARNDDLQTAVVSGGIDLISFALPMLCASARAGAAAGRALGTAARPAGRGLTAAAASVRPGAQRALPKLRDVIKTAVRTFRSAAAAPDPLPAADATRMARAMRASHPRLANVFARAALRRRAASFEDGAWRLPAQSLAAAKRDPGIRPLATLQARAANGDTLAVLPYGDARSRVYTMVDAWTGNRQGPLLAADREGRLYRVLSMEALSRHRVASPSLRNALGARRAGADGTHTLEGRHYARIGDDYVQVARDPASTAGRPVWRVVTAPGARRDRVPHRLFHDPEKSVWRHADAPGLRGGGRGPAPAHAQASGAGNASIRTPDPYGALLIGRVRGGATAPQRNAIDALLSRLRATPRGDAILRAMQACHEKLGQVPEIVLIDDDPAAGQRPSLAEPVRGGVWHLHLSALASDDDAAVRELAAVYNNMTGLLQGGQPFREVYLNAFFRAGRPAFEPALEAEWAAWAGGDARRRLAVNSMRQQLWLADCFGGLDKDAFIRVLQDELAPVPEGPSIHLYDRGLDAVPPLRDNTYELKIDHNRITDWRNLSRAKGLRRLSARDTGAGVFDELPPTLVFLDVSWNHLTRLPADRLARLEALEYLDVSNNLLGQIDGLPRTLKVLQAGRNSLASLPPLPPDLTTLIADHNVLTRISAPMPDTLETLVLSDNDLPGVPDLSATRIHTLKLARNRELAALPALPPTLSLLDVEDCALEMLPTPLPAAIETVIASGNRLRDLPRGVPAGTRLLDVRDNALTGVPAEIDTPSCTILLDGNPIPIRVQEDLTARFRAGAGPQVRFIADEDPALDTASGTLADAARAWLGDEDAAAAARWEAIGADVRETPEDRAAGGQFARFLDYLRQSVSHDDPDFRADVREWLAELAKPERKPLLERTLQACVTASEQCEDRVSLTLSELRRLRVHDDVRLGIYEPRKAVDALRQTFRIGKLQEIAYRHIKSDGHLDDVEVYLAYAVGLRDRLGLSLVAPRMRFMSVSRVTSENLDAALQEVLDAEGKEFYRYLVLDDSWNALIRQRLGERYAQAEAQLHQLAGTPLQEKIRAELQARGIDGADTDAQRELGHAVWRDMKFEVLEPLTRRYLADAQLAVPEQG